MREKELLSLYNALNMSHYENPDDLEIITLDNALILEQRNENILKYGLVKIPTPVCIVLYNGMEKRPEVEILKLSDAFENQEVDYCIDADHLRSFLIRNRAEVEPMLLSEGTVEEYVDSMNEVKEQEIERLKRELSKETQEKDEKLSSRAGAGSARLNFTLRKTMLLLHPVKPGNV